MADFQAFRDKVNASILRNGRQLTYVDPQGVSRPNGTVSESPTSRVVVGFGPVEDAITSSSEGARGSFYLSASQLTVRPQPMARIECDGRAWLVEVVEPYSANGIDMAYGLRVAEIPMEPQA